jgi:tetratricopeptide (TPR) repeat protein
VISSPSHRRLKPLWILALLTILTSSVEAGVSRPATGKSAKNPVRASKRQPAGKAQQELQRRVAAQVAAKRSANPAAVEQTTRNLVALALRELALLRTLETAWPQAIELYKQSLNLEEDPAARIDLAIAYMRSKQPNDAIFECDRILFSYPENARAWHVKGEAYLLQKDWTKAEEALKKSVEIHPDLNALYSLGTTQLMQKQKESGVATFQRILKERNSAALHVLLGDAYGEAGYNDEAVAEYKKATEMNPELPHVFFFLGLGYLMRDEWAPSPEALTALTEEVKRHPNGYFGNYYLGVIDSAYNNFEPSNKYLLLAAQAKPNLPETWLYLGINAAAQKNDAKAEEYLRKAIEITGKDESRNNFQIVRAYFTLGRMEMARGNKQNGSELLAKAKEMSSKKLSDSRQAIAGMGGGAAVMPIEVSDEEKQELRAPREVVDPTAELDASVRAKSKLTPEQLKAVGNRERELRAVLASSYNDWGTAKARQQDYSAAYQFFIEAEKWDGNVPGVLRNLGLAAFRVGDYKEAARVLEREAAKHPDPKIQSMLAASLFSTAQFPAATTAFQKLGESVYADSRLAYSYAFSLAATKKHLEAANVLNKLSSQNLSAEMLLQVGQVYGDIGDNDRALACFKRVLEIDPGMVDAHYNTGLVLIRMDRPADAAHELEKAYQANPADVNAQYNFAYALLKSGQREKALGLLRSLISENPNHALAQYQLGKELLDEGKTEEAVQCLEKAAAIDTNKDFIHFQLQAAYRKLGRTADAERELKLYREIKARNREQTLPMPGNPSAE